jgi:hypothetical protein
VLNPALAPGLYRFVLTAISSGAGGTPGRRLEVSRTTLQSSASHIEQHEHAGLRNQRREEKSA